MKIGDFHLLINLNFLKCVMDKEIEGWGLKKEQGLYSSTTQGSLAPHKTGTRQKNPAALISANT